LGTTLNSSKKAKNTGAGPLQLAGALDTYTAAGLRDTLETALRDRSELTLDLSAVESCDFSTLQLILSVRRSAELAGKPFAIAVVSGEVTQACAALGVSLETAPAGERNESCPAQS